MSPINAVLTVETIAGPGIPLYEVRLTLQGERPLRYRRAVKTREEARKIASQYARRIKAHNAGDGVLLDLSTDWRVAP